MDETYQLVDALKRCVKSRGLTYRALASRIKLSEASVKRIFAQRSFTVRRLEQVCQAMDMSVTELIRMIDRSASAVTLLSLAADTDCASAAGSYGGPTVPCAAPMSVRYRRNFCARRLPAVANFLAGNQRSSLRVRSASSSASSSTFTTSSYKWPNSIRCPRNLATAPHY